MIESKQPMRDVPAEPPPRVPPGLEPLQFVMLGAVRVLYGVLLLSTAAIVWVAIAVTRHIVQHRRAIRSQAEQHDDPV